MPDPPIEGARSMSAICLQWLYETAQGMASIVEVGSYKGRSTHALCSGCPGTVTAVDHWIMMFGPRAGTFRAGALATFKENVGHFKNLNIIQAPSLEAVLTFKDASIDMVFIDGDHSYEGVKADVLAWIPKAKKLICGHDYHGATPGVIQAVEELFPGRFRVIPQTNIWAVDLEVKSGDKPETGKRGRKPGTRKSKERSPGSPAPRPDD
jgi:hypothetical protein